MSDKKKITIQSVLALQGIVAIYSLAGAAGKVASAYNFLSPGFILFYGMEILLLGLYAILWQQIIKRFDLSVAYANRAVALLWSMLWAVAFFHEKLTPANMLGILIVMAGTMVVNSDAS